MEITFFDRKYNPKEISIEKVFNQLREEMGRKGILYRVVKNPFDFGLLNIFRGIFYFSKQKGQIKHISGYIHWSILLQNSKNTILTIHDIGRYWELSGWRRVIFYYLWIYLPIKKAKFVTVISQKTKDDILSLLPNCSNLIQVIPNCVTLEMSSQERRSLSSIPKVVMVGTRSNKNIERSIVALRGINISLTIVGELTKDQIDLLEENEIRYQNVKFISEEELVSIYQSSDILLFMSLFEGFGLPVLEAQSQNCIVITSSQKPLSDVGGLGAYYADPLSIASIRGAVENVMALSPTEYSAAILRGKQNVQLYSVDAVTERYIELYIKIIESDGAN